MDTLVEAIKSLRAERSKCIDRITAIDAELSIIRGLANPPLGRPIKDLAESNARKGNHEAVLAYLRHAGPTRMVKIAIDLGVSKQRVHQGLKKLRADGRVSLDGKLYAANSHKAQVA